MSGLAKMASITAYKANEADLAKTGLLKDNNNKNFRWLVCEAKFAQGTLDSIDKMIEAVDSKRAALGAIQNHSCDILAA